MERGLNLMAELSVESSCGKECLLRALCGFRVQEAVEFSEILSVKKGSSHFPLSVDWGQTKDPHTG
jgi:hypothetical protein